MGGYGFYKTWGEGNVSKHMLKIKSRKQDLVAKLEPSKTWRPSCETW